MAATDTPPSNVTNLPIELNGINVIDESERKGKPSDLFWPWCAANISVLGVSYGSYILGFGISFWQATMVGIIGVILSFLICGFVAIAGKRGSAPTMIESRAAFGVNGNALPSALSWMLLVGWETILATLATLATATVFEQLGWSHGTVTKVIAFLVVIALVAGAGILGFDVIMKVQTWITIATAVLTVGYIALTVSKISWSTMTDLPSGSWENTLGAFVMVLTGFGLGWANSAADYSRYLPRTASTRGVVGWTTFGSAIAPLILVVYGLMLVGSNMTALSDPISADPIGALATILPTWYLVPFVIVAVLGLVGGAVLDIYSSGLALLTLGVRLPRYMAAGIDGIIMTIGTIYIVFFADNFLTPFMGFLITLGVPIAGWVGVMLADIAMRRRPYAEAELYRSNGRYGSITWPAVLLVVVGTVLGWGLVTNTNAGWLHWQGYLLEPFGLGGKEGAWAYANLGVLVAIVIGFAGWLILGRRTIRRQEAK